MEGGLLRQSFHVAVTVKPLFRDKHAVDELSADLGRLVEISCRFLLFINATISQRRDSHEHVVQPDGVVLGAVACECAVGQAVLSVFDESEIIFYQVGQRQGRVGDTRLHHGTTHGSGIVQCFRVQDLFHLCVGIFVLFVKLAESRSDFGQEFETADDVILVSVISRHFGGIQQCLISHAPFIAPDAERAPVERGAVGNVPVVGHFFAVGVQYAYGSMLLNVGEYPVDVRLDLFSGQVAVGYFVFRSEQVQRSRHVVDFGFLRRDGVTEGQDACGKEAGFADGFHAFRL